MKNTKLLLAIATSAALLTGCQNTHGIDTNMAISSGLNAYKAATLSDADAKAIANQGCAEMDSGNQVASKSSKYGKRLAKIAKALGNNINGTPVNYKVYMTSDVNAWVKRRTKNAKAFHDKCENFSFRASNETAVLITAFYSLHGDHLGYG